MRAAVVLFTRDLRVRDHPALAEAVSAAERVVPLFVLDDAILAGVGANRVRFLLEALADLRESLRALGGRLVVRRGDPVAETAKVVREAGAEAVFASADVSAYAQARERRLREERAELRLFPGVTVVPPGEVLPAGGDHFRVFTPYWRRWAEAEVRPVRRAPRRLSVPAGIAAGRLPALADLVRGEPSPEVVEGGETAGRARLERWLRSGLAGYGERRDDLAADGTSRLSPYLHFGCDVRRWVEELAGVEGGGVHEPWKLRGVAGYPPPLVDHAEAVARFRLARGR